MKPVLKSLRHAFAIVLATALYGTACAQVPLGDASAVEHIVTAKLDGHSISGLVSHLPGHTSFKYGIAVFPGYPSIMRLHNEDGAPVFQQQGSLMVKGRRLWLDNDTLVLTVDAPDDEWGSFDHYFRRSPRYGKDVAALLTEVMKQYPVADWTFVGHSEGAVSAYGGAVPNLDKVKRLVLISSVIYPTRNGPGLSALDWDMLAGRLLWVHHTDDPCDHTPYSAAQKFAADTHSPLLTVRGGSEGHGDPCRAGSIHSLPGMEKATFDAIKTWIKTGTAPASVGP